MLRAVTVVEVMFAILERQGVAVPNFRVSHVLKFERPNHVVFVSVGFKNVPDCCAFVFGKLRVDFAVSSGVNNCGFSVTGKVVTVVG